MGLQLQASANPTPPPLPTLSDFENDRRALIDQTNYFIYGSLLTLILFTAPLTISTPIIALIPISALIFSLLLIYSHLLDLHTLIAHLVSTTKSVRLARRRLAMYVFKLAVRSMDLEAEVENLKAARRRGKAGSVTRGVEDGMRLGVNGAADLNLHDIKTNDKQKHKTESAIAYVGECIAQVVNKSKETGQRLQDQTQELLAQGIKVRDFASIGSEEGHSNITSTLPAGKLLSNRTADDGVDKANLDENGDLEVARLEMAVRQRVLESVEKTF